MAIKKIEKKQFTAEDIERLHNFYTWHKTKDGKGVVIELNRLRITNRLKSLGYYRYDLSDGSTRYVHIENGKIRIIQEVQIRDAFEDYIKNLPDRTVYLKSEDKDGNITEMDYTIDSYMILDCMYKSLQTWFNTFERLRPDNPIEIIEDEHDSKYFYFRNTAVKVSHTGIVNVPYEELNGCIWENSIHERDFTYTPTKGDFEQFFENICGRDDQRKQAAMTLLGYLMHDYYESNLAAVLLTDVNKEGAGRDSGRTGKGLLGKALGEMLNRDSTGTKYVAIDGKKFEPDEGDGKCYSAADMSTQLIHIEDLKSTFNLEPIYSDITDGCTMRKLHENKTKKMVKFLLSMNTTLYKLDSESVRGRLYIFELANYYKSSYRPTDEFRWFWGREWTDKDWNEFYSFMLRCQLLYFQKGVIEPQDINYYTRSLKESLPDDFYYWFEALVQPYVQQFQTVRFRKKEDLFEAYQRKYFIPNDEKTRRKFTGWCKRYLDRMSIPYKEIRSTVDYLVLYPTSND